ncbi:MAG TPA: cytochrome b/b6 domain-containing protein [Candidatus Methylomirabilis sp.]|nr:cytochrome b/b6 domain-containing protein [Candidatus Methylomirabilis sp.]
MTSETPRLVRRYLPAQRLIHWIGVLSFLTLLLSGMALLYPPLSFLAAGGLSRLIHRIAVIPFVLLPIAYALLLRAQTKELLIESLTYTREDWEWLKGMPAYLVGRTHGLPPQGRLNAGQKLHHGGTFLMFVSVSVSGIVLWFGKGHLGPGGLAGAAMLHDLSMLGLSVLLIGHVYFTFLYDAFSAMRTGFVSEPYARMEHLKWLETLPPEAFVGGEKPSRRAEAEPKTEPPAE